MVVTCVGVREDGYHDSPKRETDLNTATTPSRQLKFARHRPPKIRTSSLYLLGESSKMVSIGWYTIRGGETEDRISFSPVGFSAGEYTRTDTSHTKRSSETQRYYKLKRKPHVRTPYTPYTPVPTTLVET